MTLPGEARQWLAGMPTLLNYQLPTTSHQLPTTNHQPPTTNYQLSTINYQLPTINYQLIMTTVLHHPLVDHRMTYMRDVATQPKLFRELVSEITTFLAY